MDRIGFYLFDAGRRQVERFDTLEQACGEAELRLKTASGIQGDPQWIVHRAGEHRLYKQLREDCWYDSGLMIRERHRLV